MKQRTFLLVLAAFILVFGGAAASVSAFNLAATFEPETDKPEPGKPFSFQVVVTNNDSATTATNNRVSVSRHTISPGGQIDGYGVKIGGFSGQSVPAIDPGQTAFFDFSDTRPPLGRFVYRIKFSAGGRYDTKEMYATFAHPEPVKFTTTGSNNAAIHAEYKVDEQYPEPGDDFTFSVQVTNKSNAETAANRLSISKHTVSTGGRIDNYGTLLGGSGGGQQIPALTPGNSIELNFVDPRPSPGTFVYRMKFSSGGSYRAQEMSVTFSTNSEVEVR